MAYVFIGSGTFSNNVGASGSINYTATAGNTLKVYSLTNAVPTGLTISDGSNTYTLLGSVTGGGVFLGEWRAHVATGGALTIIMSAAGTYGMWLEEISGLATSSFIAGSFQSQTQNGPGVGANILTTSANPNATSAPAMVSAFSVNVNAFTVPSSDAGPSLGTSSAFNSRTVGWIGVAQQAALAEDIRVTVTGTKAMTFGTVSGNQFDTFLTVASADVEAVPGPIGVVQSAFNNGGSWPTSTSVTLNGVTAGNAILIVTPAVNNTSGSPSLVVTDSVNTVTELEQIASFGLSSVFALLDFSIIPSASAGTHVLTATIGSGTGFGCIEAIEIYGLNSSAAVDVFSLNAAGGGSNPTTGSSATPASTNEIAVAAVSGYENGTALTIGSPAGYTNIVKFESGSGFVQCSVDYLTPVALTAQSATWTGMTVVNSYAAGVIVLKAAANQATVMWWI